MEVRIYRICKENPLPTRAHELDAGFDVYASEEVIFKPDEIKLVPLGIIAEAPFGFHFKLCLRSSMALKRGFTQRNAPGIIDRPYCGPNDEIKILLKAPSQDEIDTNGYTTDKLIVKKGERVGQLLLEENCSITWQEQKSIDFAGSNRGGFGSTGK